MIMISLQRQKKSERGEKSNSKKEKLKMPKKIFNSVKNCFSKLKSRAVNGSGKLKRDICCQ